MKILVVSNHYERPGSFTGHPVHRLSRELLSLGGRYDVLVPRWRNGYIEPLCGVYQAECFQRTIEENISVGDFRLRNLFRDASRVRYFNIEERLKAIDPGFRHFQNVNRREI